MKRLSLIVLSLFALNAFGEDLSSKMNALGANKDLMKKARAIDPHNRVRVVQNREVDRHFRLEVGLNYGMANGGDPYINTSILGGTFDFHITPRWSLGGRYLSIQNELTTEGKAVMRDYEMTNQVPNANPRQPRVDYAKSALLAVLNWYPIYGKLNLFDAGISQFDIYFLGGAGQVELGSGSTMAYTAGGGVGIWFTQHVASRLEARWQGYTDKPYNGSGLENRDINQTILTATVSFLL